MYSPRGAGLLMIDRKRLVSWLLLIASLCLIYSWPLQVAYGDKIGYWIFAVISAVILFLTKDARWSPVLSVYCLIITCVVVVQMAFISLPLQQAFQPLVLYLFVPFIYGRKIFDEDQLHWLLRALLICVPINFIGTLLQLSGYNSVYLVLQQTATLELLHDRYASFMGGVLSLGYVSMFNAICSLYYLLMSNRKKDKILYGVLFVLAIFTLYFSFTRRFYVIFIIAAILMAIHRYNWRRVVISLVAIISITIVFNIVVVDNMSDKSYNFLFLDRFASTFDFSGGDEGNEYRILKGIQAIDWSLTSPFLGLGVGSVGTIGKSIEELSENFDEAMIAETYYLHVAIDFGIFVAVYFLLFMLYLFYKSIIEFHISGSIAALLLVLYPIDCIGSVELAGPFPAVMFWLCMGVFFSGFFFMNNFNIGSNF